jgi:hypothetical protein
MLGLPKLLHHDGIELKYVAAVLAVAVLAVTQLAALPIAVGR